MLLSDEYPILSSPKAPRSLIEILRRRAAEQPQEIAYTFLKDSLEEAESLTYLELEARVRAVAARILRAGGSGDRALLLYPSGLEFVTAFLACLAAGVVAVPTYPPRSRHSLPRLEAIAADSRSQLILTTSALLPRVSEWAPGITGSTGVVCLATDEVDPGISAGWSDPGVEPATLAFLQYTSGSTALPKGVEVSHGNLLHNEEMIRRAFRQSRESIIVSWLPLYHDMGLIGGVLQPAYVGARCILLSPIAFLQRPARWLEAISRYRATTSGGPSFAYDLCVRKVPEPDRAGLDLSSWEVAFNGAEPVRAETLERFAADFGSVGFQRRAFYPCYGLAEATLFVTGGDPAAEPVLAEVDRAALEQGRVSRPQGVVRRLVGCGRPAAGLEVVIADPESGRRLPADQVGEIWAAGPNVARGYWGRPEATRETFAARLADDPGAGPFLRTGDLGFLRDGELFITGRRKDLIIVRGRNLYPQDIELSAERAHPALRPGCGAAFSVEAEGEERLVVVYELERAARVRGAGAVAQAVALAVAEEHEVAVHEVLLVQAGTVPKTSSGKIQRHACRARYLAGGWETLGRSTEVEQGAAEEDGAVRELKDLAALPLAEWLRREVARAARVPVSRVFSGQALTGLLDSLAIVQLKASLDEATGVPVPLSALFAGETLGDLTARLAGGLSAGWLDAEAGPAAENALGEIPLSFGQRALWFEGRLAPESAAYHLSAALRVTSFLDVAALARAFDDLAERHPLLRTTFHARGGEPVQRVHPRLGGGFLEVDASGWDEAELQERLRREVARPFDLEAGPAFRATVFWRAPGRTLLVAVFHHLIADFWSLAVLARDLGVFYDWEAGCRPLDLAPAASYADFVRWQERKLAGPEGERLWDWWREELGQDLPVLELPRDRPRQAARTDRGAAVGLDFAPELADAVRTLARSRGVTVFNALLAAFAALLHRWTAQEELVVGAPTAGRTVARWAAVVGYFVNPVPLRLSLSGGPSFAALLDRVRDRLTGALEHQEYPLPLLVERLRPERDLSRSPLFQAMFVFHRPLRPGDKPLAALALGRSGPPLALGSLMAEPVPLEERTSQLDLTLNMAEVEEGAFAASLRYNSDLLDAATVRRMLGHFQALLTAAAGDAGCPMADLLLLSAAESSQVLREWTDTGELEPGEACLHHLFAAKAAKTPEAEALVGRGERLTYRELRARALRLARWLRALGVGPEARVGVLLERSPDLVAALLGVLEAGGAYVALDPAYPPERLRWMLEDSRCAVLLTRDALARSVGETEARVVDLGEALATDAGPAGTEPSVTPRHLAYVIYTSGSTGRPKGVAIEHRSAVALVRWARRVFSPEELSGVLAATSVCFDLSVFELFVPLSSGGRVLLAEDALDLPSLPLAGEVTLINTVPSVCAELLRLGGLPPGVRTVNLAGEPLTRALAERVWESSAGVRLLNLYGPSEDTTYSTWEPVSPEETSEPAIGRPVAGTRAYVLDLSLRPVGVGVPGQLYLGGAGLARGYLGRPELTAERFTPDPYGGRPGERLYATGDLSRWRPDSRLEFLGRIDHQVKVRGFRIELGEVEACLAGNPEVAEAAVLVREDRLVAFVVPQQAPGPSPKDLRTWTASCLPGYMVPSAFVDLAALPRTASGKVDRRALAALPVARGRARSPAALTAEEELLAGIWGEVLGLERVEREEDFFGLGGHSLLAVRVLSRVREGFGVELPVRSVFEAPTVAALAVKIAAQRRFDADRQTPALTRVPRRGPLPLSFAQERLWFLALLQPDSPWYNLPGALRLEGKLDAAALSANLSAVVRRHEALRTGFVAEDGRPVQVVHPPGGLWLPVLDLAGLPRERREAEALRGAGEEARRPFDLTRGTPLRAALMRLSGEEHLLVLVVHHIVADGWSLGVLVREVADLYDGSPLPELPIQYADFAVWQRGWLTPQVVERQLGYWRERLAGVPVLELPSDRPRTPVRGWRGSSRTLQTAAELTAALRALGRQEGATLFMVLLAGFAALLSRLSGETDFAVGTPVAGRDRVETEGLIGFFVNTLVLRTDLGGEPDFRTVVRRVREAVLEAHAHQDVPFEKLVEELRPQRSLAHSPLFQVLFAFQNVPLQSFSAGGLSFTPCAVDSGAAQFDLSLLMAEAGQGISLSLAYAADLFDPATAVRILGSFHTLLAGAAGGGDLAVWALPLLNAAEARQVLVEWNDGDDAAEPATGRPPPGTRAYVLDLHRQPVGIGVPGQLHQGGAGLARDWKRPEFAAERFVPDPFIPGERLYATGELARWRRDGRLEFLGRIDEQVKVRAREGKAREGAAAARSVEEEILAAIWREVLWLERVSREEDFFDLGGHSLLAVQVLARIRESLGVELPVRSVFEAPTLAALAARIRAAREAGDAGAGRRAPPLERVTRSGSLPLSFAQERLWFLAQLEPESPWYNIAGAMRLRGPLHAARLQASLSEVVCRHEALRTGFVAEDGRPVQVVHPPGGLWLPVLDLAGLPRERREAEALRGAGEEARRPFDLTRGTPLRAALMRLSGEEHLLVLVVHHIVADGWSLGVLVREVADLYDGSPLPELPIQYADFAVWQRGWLTPQVVERQLGYWRERLAGVPVLELPSDRPRTPVRGWRGSSRTLQTAAELTAALRALGRQEGATLFMVLLAGFAALLSRLSGETDFAVGTPVAGRDRVETEGLIGFFVNTLVLRTDLGGEPDFRTVVRRVREAVLEAHAHQDVPFEKLVEELRPQRSLAHSPLFQVLFAFQNAPLQSFSAGGLSFTPCAVDSGAAQFDLSLLMAETGQGISVTLGFATDLFAAATGRRMLEHFRTLLAGAVSDASRPLSDLPLLTPAEADQLLVEWGEGGGVASGAPCLPWWFEEQAVRVPETVAVVGSGERLTYRELNARANRLAHHLRVLGVGPEVRVGVMLERSPDLVVALLGVLKAGGGYVPLDPAYPWERLAFMLEDSRAEVVLTRESLAGRVAESGARVVDVADPGIEEGSAADPRRWSEPGHVAYVIYTSGSTGRPKGVVIEHGAAAAFVGWALGMFSRAELAGVLAATSVCFDLSVFELFVPLSTGGAVILAGDALDLLSLAAAGEVTLVNTVPSVMAELVGLSGLPSSVRVVNLAGEPLTQALVDRIHGQVEGVSTFNLYGPSEGTTYSTWERLGRGEAEEPAIGRPIAGSRCYVLDGHLQPVPVRVQGQLYLGGAGLARGYLNRPELTAERFVPDRFGGRVGERLYATGDLVRWRPDGRLEFLGRIDQQVKVRGFRIELGEVEACLAAHPGVAEAAVSAVAEGAGRRLVAYVVARRQPGPSPIGLRGHLEERLPGYMVPTEWVELEELPRTVSGKLDRRALPQLEVHAVAQVAARGVVEEMVAGIWCEVLGLERVGAEENFFTLGGHSLLAVRVLSRLRDGLRVELPVRALFEAPTVAELAARIEMARRLGSGGMAPPAPPLVAVQRGGEPPLSYAQERLWFLAQLEPESPWYNIAGAVRLRGPLKAVHLQASFSEVVRRHEALRTGFVEEDGRPVQVIHPPGGLRLPVLDLSGLPRERREAEALRQAGEEAWRPFDLTLGAPIRAALVRLSGEEHLLVLAVHHIVADGWSLEVLVREVGALYAGSPLPELPVQYADFAVWQRGWLTEEVMERQLAFWRERLAGVPVLELPSDRPRLAARRWRGTSRPLEAGDKELAASLRALARREESTLFMVLLTGFVSLLRRLTGEPDFAVGMPVAGRDRVETEGLIGFFINTLVLRTDLGGDPGFRTVLRQVREAVLEAHARMDVPFEKLVEELRPQRSLSHSPLFQVLFGFQSRPLPVPGLPGVLAEAVELEQTVSRFDLSLALEDTALGLRGTVTCDTDLFDLTTVLRWTSGLFRLLAGAVSEPSQSVLDLPLLSTGEIRQILGEWNDREVSYPLHLALHELVEAQAARTPAAVAVSFEGRTLTYRELDARAEALALRLCAEGVGAEVLVAICAERSFEMVVGLLAILKAGGAWVPLDPSHPAERLSLMIADARPPVLLTQASLADRVPPYGGRVVLLDAWEGESAAGAARPPGVDPDSPVYVIFTSGSTGRPKGAVNTHRAIVNRLLEMQDAFALGPDDAVLQKTPLSFDVSVWEVFWPLIAGARVALARPGGHQDTGYLATAIAREEVTTIHFVPSVLRLFLDEPELEKCAGLRRVMVGGEALSPELARSFRARIGTPFGVDLINFYGPAEAAIEIATWRCGPREDRAPIGRPVANTRIHLLDPEGQLAPIGVAAELYAGGVQIGRGYLGRQDLTAERFVPDPLGPPGSRLYRTGDLARWLPDGTLDFLGRTDHQVKLRGYRLEPGEIEAVLARHPAVLEGAVVLRREPAGADHLVAWYVPRPGMAPAAAELREFLSGHLPEPWIPALFLPLETLPRLPAGKVDRRALGAREAARPDPGGAEVPRTPGEEIAVGLFAELLGLPRVGANEDFFALGGHSLLATRLVSRVRQAFGVELPLRRLFEAPTPAALARAVEETRRDADGLAAPPLVPLPRDGALPLSFAQQRLWLLDQLDPGSPAYNLPATVRLEGRLDSSALERALAEICRRHEALRTTFPAPAGEPVQEVGPPQDFVLSRVDLTGLPDPTGEAGLLVTAEARRPFDLARGPLARVCLVRLRPEEHVLLLTLHHIVADGWSIGVLVREMAALYRAFAAGKPSPLAALPVQYADFARWQREWLRGEVLERGLAYWRGQLAGAPRVLDLPMDRPRPAVPSQRGAIRRLRLSAGLREDLAALARREGATLFMTLLAAFQALLFRMTGREDLVVGSPVANRNRAEIEGLIGFFVNLLALRVRLGGATGRELLARLREVALAAYAHQDIPFDKLAEELGGERGGLSHAPLFQVVFALQEDARVGEALPGLTLRPLIPDSGTAKFDLAVSVRPGDDGIHVHLEHSTDLFEGTTIERLGAGFSNLLAAIAADPCRPLSALPLLDEVERAQLVAEWNDTAFDVTGLSLVHELFSEQVCRSPQAAAVVSASGTLSYGELAHRAGRLARTLSRLGVGPEIPVGACLDRSPELVVAFLGVLQAGGAFVPIDPSQPGERVALLVEDTRMPVLLTRGDLSATLPPLPALLLSVEAWEGPPEEKTRALPVPDAGNLAYVIYTSGSTGRPKGVEVSHRSLANLAAWHRRTYGVTAADRATLIAGVAFDASIWEIWPYLTAGASLLVPEEEVRVDAERLSDWIATRGVTLSFLPTPLAEEVLAACRPLGEGFRFLLTGGDRLRRRASREAGFSLVNHYGPTEATVVSTAGTVPPHPPPAPVAPSIGRPIGNTSVHLLDPGGEPVPVGVVGELCVGGTGVARGYLRRPGLTAERFVPDPFQPGARLYRTGDLARRLADGSLEFVGRIDHQVKIRGHRIELGEVEVALAAYPGVRQVVVEARGGPPEDLALVAYVAADGALEAQELRAFLHARLPVYMVPAAFVLLPELPLTPNGKVDRRALPPPEEGASAGRAFVPPRTAVEQVLAGLWQQLLQRDRVGLHDDFFELGGHSLLATRLASRLRQVFKVDLSLRSLLQDPTVAGIAGALVASEAAPGESEKIARVVQRLQAMPAAEVRERLRSARGGAA